jgi:hypothetical protein
MRLKNYTNFEDKRIREIIQFVRPNGISNFDVRISNSKTTIFYGRCYYDGAEVHYTADPFIVARITRNENEFPYLVQYTPQKKTRMEYNPKTLKFEFVSYSTGSRGYIDNLLLSREEALVHVIAHELRHLWQAKIKKGHRVWGARGQFSEKDADAYAIRKTREWRHKKNKTTELERLSLEGLEVSCQN